MTHHPTMTHHPLTALSAECRRLLLQMCTQQHLDPDAPFLLFDKTTPGYEEYSRMTELYSRMLAKYNEERLADARREVRRIQQVNARTGRRYEP
jgi:hypothetical protein